MSTHCAAEEYRWYFSREPLLRPVRSDNFYARVARVKLSRIRATTQNSPKFLDSGLKSRTQKTLREQQEVLAKCDKKAEGSNDPSAVFGGGPDLGVMSTTGWCTPGTGHVVPGPGCWF